MEAESWGDGKRQEMRRKEAKEDRIVIYLREEGHRSRRYCNTRSMRGVDGASPFFQLPCPKINLIYGPRVGDVSDIKLIRTDTTLDLSQKAEKRYHQWLQGTAWSAPAIPPTDGSQHHLHAASGVRRGGGGANHALCRQAGRAWNPAQLSLRNSKGREDKAFQASTERQLCAT